MEEAAVAEKSIPSTIFDWEPLYLYSCEDGIVNPMASKRSRTMIILQRMLHALSWVKT